ncbi:efflux RND transporter permease subunit [Halodesulfovibrio spirochaetisodalis]|uniref:efflux RND transporter permease subunit n=1 Tax=Halodesulfovibrio spirochaetisodalis TaxID=1560234 RepID=UPI0008322224|nr:efflux RND transporter permease subunit [Halodesulfovibrio spirochaetisodalis]
MSNKQRSGAIAWFVHNPVAANLVVLLILIGGCIVGYSRPKQAFPPFPPKTITIHVGYESSSAESVEQSITIKIEEALNGVRGIKETYSTSSLSGSTVVVEKKTGYPLSTLMRDVKSKVNAIDTLPARADRPVVSQEEWDEHILYIHLYGDAPQETLQTLADKIRRKLLLKPNISTVRYQGRRTKEIAIEVNEGMLQASGLTLQDITSKIQKESVIDSGGELKTDLFTITLRADHQAYTEEDFRAIPLRTAANGAVITLGDIANVRDTYKEETILNRFQGAPSIGLELVDTGGTDITIAAAEAYDVIDGIKKSGLLPDTVSISTWYDQSEYINSRVSLLVSNGLSGIALVIIVLALFLNLRLAFWVSFGIPVSIAGAFIIMGENVLNYTLNELTSFGFIVSLGILVDDAIVIGENIFTARSEGNDPVAATIAGASEVATPATFGVLTTVAAFLPLAFIKGEFGQIFGQFAIVVICCLLFSLIESKFILPAHLAQTKLTTSTNPSRLSAMLIYAQQQVTRSLTFFKTSIYTPFMRVVFKVPGITLLSFCCLLICLFALMFSGRIRVVFFPNITGNIISATVEMDQEAGPRQTLNNALHVEKALYETSSALQHERKEKASPVTNVQANVTSSTGFTVTAQLNQQGNISPETIATRWQKTVGAMEGVDLTFFDATVSKMKNIDIELVASSPLMLERATKELTDKLAEYAGVYNIRDNVKTGQPQLSIRLKPDARNLGVTQNDLTSQLRGGFQGYEAQRFQQGQDDVRVQVRYPATERRYYENLRNTRIPTTNGSLVPLEVVADIIPGHAPVSINHSDGNRVANIYASTDKDITSPDDVLNDLSETFIPSLRKRYPDIAVYFSGEAKEKAEATKSLWGAFIITLIMIYTLLAIPLKSYTKPFIIMAAIPFGFIGAIGGHMLLGYPISLLSLFGILALCGVVVNDSLLLVTEYATQRELGLSINDALLTAACKRMRSILLTSITTFIGLFPLLLETSEQAQYLIPAAISMGYGILFATAITLVLVPALIRFFHDLSEALAKLLPAAYGAQHKPMHEKVNLH